MAEFLESGAVQFSDSHVLNAEDPASVADVAELIALLAPRPQISSQAGAPSWSGGGGRGPKGAQGAQGASGASEIAIGEPVISGTPGSILFVGAGSLLAQDNARLFWDESTGRLILNAAAPHDVVYQSSVTGDTDARFQIEAGGMHHWGNGSSPSFISMSYAHPIIGGDALDVIKGTPGQTTEICFTSDLFLQQVMNGSSFTRSLIAQVRNDHAFNDIGSQYAIQSRIRLTTNATGGNITDTFGMVSGWYADVGATKTVTNFTYFGVENINLSTPAITTVRGLWLSSFPGGALTKISLQSDDTAAAMIHAGPYKGNPAGVVHFATASQATNATTGWLTIPSCAGTPTGVPANLPAGQVGLTYDRTNSKVYVYDGGWKRGQVAGVDVVYA